MNLDQSPGSKYNESGKIDIGRFFLFLVIGYILSALTGIGYGLLSDLNPIIYLNFILLGIAAVLVTLAAGLFKTAGKLRNRYVTMFLALFFGIVCVYNAWTAIYAYGDQSVFGGILFQKSPSELLQEVSARNLSIGKLGRDGAGLGTEITFILYVVEFLILTVGPAWFVVKDPSYFCEDCDKPMVDNEYFFGLDPEKSESIVSDLKVGKLSQLFTMTSYPEKSLNLKLSYVQCNSRECPNCNKIVYSAELGKAKMDKENTTFDKEQLLALNLFGQRKMEVNQETNTI